MKKASKVRLGYFIGFILVIGLLGLAEYLEVYKGMVPCPLCMLQRIVLIMLGTLFFVGMVFRLKKMGLCIVSLLSLIVSLSGIFAAGRQSWLQHMPSNHLGECGASLSYMFQTLPLMEVFKHVWTGGIECSQQGWAFMSLSLADWSLIGFAGFFVFTLWQVKRSLNS